MAHAADAAHADHHEHIPTFWRRWFYSTNHKDIGTLYMIFGFIAGVVAAYRGLNPKGGPKGVGDAVNQAVVITFLLLFFVNFVLTTIYLQVVPAKGS